MNVLISSGFRWWNAEAAYAAVLARLLRDAGHGAWIAAPTGTPHAEALARRGLAPEAGLCPSVANPLRWPAEAKRLRAFLVERRIDVVDVLPPAEFPLYLLATRGLPGVRLIRTRGGAQLERGDPLNRWLYTRADGVIASCEAIRRRLIDKLRVPPPRIRTIYYPAEPDSAPGTAVPGPAARDAARARLLAELGLGPERLLIAVVGRIAPEKGHEPLLEALRAVAQALPGVLLLILNKAEPGEARHRRRIERAVAAGGLEPWVRWLGFRADVRAVMSACDLGVIPSIASEMNCRVAMEFFAAGTPVVAFPTGALPEVIVHGQSGLVAESHRPEHLAAALIRLGADPALRERLGRGAQAEAAGRFSPEAFLRQTIEAFAGESDAAPAPPLGAEGPQTPSGVQG